MKKAAFLFIFIIISTELFSQNFDNISDYDIIWDSPSLNSAGSMPLGNGDIGINIWAEKSGDIYCYISKIDSWGEYCNLLKVGKVKINISPNPFKEKYSFTQHLDLKNGQIIFKIKEKNKQINIRAWVDANNPVINFQFDSADEYYIEATPVVWRAKPRKIEEDERHGVYGFTGSKDPIYIFPDTLICSRESFSIVHQNKYSIWKETLEKIGMLNWTKNHEDPLLNSCFGYSLYGEKMKREGSTLLFEKPATKRKYIKILVHSGKYKNVKDYLNTSIVLRKKYEKTIYEKNYSAHIKHWNNFWDKSYIFVKGDSNADLVTKSYILTKYMIACAGRGKYPQKFNGSIFTVDSCENDKPFDADYRMWGGPYWSQNTRLLYWPLLNQGNFSYMLPFFNMYLNALPFAMEQTKVLYNHSGVFFPETMYFWGSYNLDNFGWDTDYKNFKHTKNQYIRYYFDGGLEVISMMIDYYNYTSDEKFAKTILFPVADQVLKFYFTHYKTDEKGKLNIYPSQALETYWDVKNPANVVAGLRWVLQNLLSLPKSILGQKRINTLGEYFDKAPSIPFGEKDGKKVILYGESVLSEAKNMENPELYAVFPYRFFGVGKYHLDVALNTYEISKYKEARCWQQYDVVSAFLGVTDTAKKYLIERCRKVNKNCRFPAMWGGSFDWTPDTDNGGNLLLALQTMLMQTDKEKIILFPAWPKEWDVQFKLYAPDKTVISGIYKNGKVEKIESFPSTRKENIENLFKR